MEGVPLTLRNLVGSVVVLARMWSGCGWEFCLKVALEFNLTESRAQRHNYKKRLQEVGKTHPEWSERDCGGDCRSVSKLRSQERFWALKSTGIFH